jgi:formate dehydrogenase iron-sulfur subunit
MIKQAEGRITDLKSRGYKNAGLYDPKGVGGTHVMYVLQHADKPEAYNALPRDPGISPMVSVWKGVTKPILSAVLGLAVFGALVHYVTVGPKAKHEEE